MKLSLLLPIFVIVLGSDATPVYRNTSNIDDGDIAKRAITGNSDADHMIKGFREMMIRGMLMLAKSPNLKWAKLGMMAHPVGIATVMVLTLIEVMDNSESEWSKLEKRMTTKIYAAVSDYHFNDIDTTINMLHLKSSRIADVCRDFPKQDLEDILTYQSRFFPQNYDQSTGFDIRWVEKNLQYLTLLSSIFISLMVAKRTDTCAWARELVHLKPEVLNAARALARGRWKELELMGSAGGYPGNPASLSFRDKYLNKEFNEIKVPDIEEKVFKFIANDTNHYLWTAYIRRFNSLFGGAFTPRGANVTCAVTVKKKVKDENKFEFNAGHFIINKKKKIYFDAMNARSGKKGRVEIEIKGSGGWGVGGWFHDDDNNDWETGDKLIVDTDYNRFCGPANLCAVKVTRVSEDRGLHSIPGGYFYANRLSISGINFIDDLAEGQPGIFDKVAPPDPITMKIINGRTKKEGHINVTYNAAGAEPDEFVGFFNGDDIEIKKDQWRVGDYVIILNATYCNTGCNPPKPITKEELNLPSTFPKNCFDGKNECDLPCGSYGHNEKWCPLFQDGNTNLQWVIPELHFGVGAHNPQKTEPLDYIRPCQEPDFAICYHVDRLPLINWVGRIGKIDKSKKEIPDGCPEENIL